MNKKRVLQLTHELKAPSLLSGALESLGYLIEAAPDTKIALEALSRGDCDLVITNKNGEHLVGLNLGKRLQSKQP